MKKKISTLKNKVKKNPEVKEETNKNPKILKKKKEEKVNKKNIPTTTKGIIKKRGRIKTGINGLDPLIQGGLKDKSITLVAGDAGSGKTIFAMQFLMEGLKKGDTCLYITFEEKKEKLYDDISVFNWDFKKYEDQKKFFYLEYSPEQVKSLIEEGGGTVDQLITKHKITRLVIDSVTSFSLLYKDELSRKEAGLALFELINKWGCTAMLTSQAESKKYELINSSLEFEADSIILLYHYKEKGKRIRAIEILKMRGTKHTDNTMKIEISNSGFSVKASQIIRVD